MINRRILLVDDTPAIHEDYRKSLVSHAASELDSIESELFGSTPAASASAFELDSAFQGQQACESVSDALSAQRPYALAFVDMRMPPGWDGARTVQAMWQIDPRVQIVICTAYSDHDWGDLLADLQTEGRLLILKKPFDPIEVRQMAESLCRKWALEREVEAQIEHLNCAVDARTAELADSNRLLQLEIDQRVAAQQTLAASESRYRQLFEDSPMPMWVYDGESLAFLAVNRAAIEHYGYRQDEFLQMNVDQLEASDETLSRHSALLEAAALEREQQVSAHRCKDGRLILVIVRAHSMQLDGRPAQMALLQDVSDRLQAELRVRRMNRMISLTSGVNALIVRVSSRGELFESLCRLAVQQGEFALAWVADVGQPVTPLACSAREVVESGEIDLVDALRAAADSENVLWPRLQREQQPLILSADDADSPLLADLRRRHCQSMAMVPFRVQGELVAALILYAREADYFDADELRLLSELGSDVSFALDHLNKEAQLNYLAYYDTLTGLANRALFCDRLQQTLGRTMPEGCSRCVLLIDLRRFRHINTLGRSLGDAFLQAVALRLQTELSALATVARLGSDCFALCLTQPADEAAIAWAIEQQVLAQFLRPFQVGDQDYRVTVHIGAALYPGDGDDAESLIKNAEAALKRAKRMSEPVVFYSPEMNARVASVVRLENRLRQAIDRREFLLHYQPQVRAGDHRLIGLEALVRWQPVDGELVMPGSFIAVAEDAGLIADLGRFVLFDACRQASEWLADGHGDFVVAVNVSAVQLHRPGFVDEVRAAIAEHQLPPQVIELEITESAIMENIDRMGEVLHALKRLGVTVALDDFGTGYSSLSRLRHLPIDKLKIDQSFVSDLATSADAAAIVKTIIAMSHQLQKTVIAEGVETHAQLDFLCVHGVDECQGRLFGMAVPEALAKNFLGARVPPREDPSLEQVRARP